MKKLLLSLVFAMPLLAFQTTQNGPTVYICTGSRAVVYHSNSHCRGINRCSGDIQAVSLSKAKEMGRRACRICCR